MKYKARFAIGAVGLVLLFFFWPDLSFQNYSYEQVLQLSDLQISSDLSLEEKCTRYFHTIDKISQANPSSSRYLSYSKVSNHIDHLRVYLRCFVENDVHNGRKLAYSGSLLPMFSGELPIASDYHDWRSMQVSERSFWSNYVKSAKGRGIVISLHESGSSYAERLLRVLKELQNELPIQFIHEKPISKNSKSRILKEASTTEQNQLEQKVEFIDTHPVLRHRYRSAFKGYNNKWFAALFSTFEHIILMDLDVVPFIRPSELFESDEYTNSGAYFFRDRELSETISQKKYDFLRSLIPKDEIFGIQVDEKLLDNNFFHFKSKHVMESGLVVIHRPTHLNGLLVSLSLQYWSKSGNIMYGDKDLFWLGQLISGNSDFYFNKNSAAAIGVSNDNNTVCSSQLGHFDRDNKLLWVNGGLLYCKRSSWFIDFFKCPSMRGKFSNSLKTMKSAYLSPIFLEEYVIPASMRVLNSEASSGMKSKLRSNFNKNYEYGCGGIFYCATPDYGGKRVPFTAEEKSMIDRIVQAWYYQNS